MPPSLDYDDRERLLAEVRALSGAPVQKLWLPSAQVCVLQLPRALVVIDARLRMAAVASQRPTAPESAPTSQATLRNALDGARLTGASLLTDSRPRLDFATERGPRALIAEHALLLIDAVSRKILWASSGARRRPGSIFPETSEIALGEGMIARSFHADIEAGSNRDGAHLDQILLESREQIAQRVLPASEQRVHVLALRNARTVLGTLGQGIAVEDQDVLEVVSERAGRRQSAHASSDYHRLSADESRHCSPPLSGFCATYSATSAWGKTNGATGTRSEDNIVVRR